jgi:hypothetical protein
MGLAMRFLQRDSEFLMQLYLHDMENIRPAKKLHYAVGTVNCADLLDEGLVDIEYRGNRMAIGLTEQGSKVVEEALNVGGAAQVH